MLTPTTCRAARGLLDWTQNELAAAAGVGITTIRTFEKGSSSPVAQNLAAIQRTLEESGIVFISEERGVGALLKAAAPPTQRGQHDSR